MHFGSIVRQAAPLVVFAAFAGSPAAAQRADDRYPFLQPVASVPAPSSEYLRVGGSREPRHRSSRPLSLVRVAEHVPFPRAVERDAFSGRFESVAASDETATQPRTRVAYATQPANDGLAIWSKIPIEPAKARIPVVALSPVAPFAIVPETSGLPHLEHRILRGRDSHVFSPDLLVLIENKAIAHGVPLDLAHAVVTVESNYDPRLTGGAGAIGLMQIKYITARDMGFRGSARDLLDPATNLEWGMRYLAKASKLAKGDLCGTVLRYQAGHGAVHMTRAAAVYCAKVRNLIAASDNAQKVARARAIR